MKSFKAYSKIILELIGVYSMHLIRYDGISWKCLDILKQDALKLT